MKIETKVGLLFLVTVGLIVGFAYVVGGINPFSNSKSIYLLYNFAGGIELGSPVRVMGIKVGKVKEIIFDPDGIDGDGKEAKLRIKLTISNKAWSTVREDSRYYINLAGLIGEKFLEITPGSTASKNIVAGKTYRGTDPPRVDQLISQGYDLFGKIIEFVEENEGEFTQTIATMNSLVKNFNAALILLDKLSRKGDMAKLVANLTVLTGDLKTLTSKLKTEDGKKTINLLYRLLWRLEAIDKESVKKFFQEEGIKANIF